jgi:hypothetical protein
MTNKYKHLDAKHQKLQLAHNKLQEMMEVLNSHSVGGESSESLRKFFESLHGKVMHEYCMSETREQIS